MTTRELLAHLRSQDAKLWADGDRLRCSAPRGVLTAELRAELSRRKEEILALLRGAAETTGAAGPRRQLLRDGPFPLSFAQQRLWLTDCLEGSVAYTIPAAVRLTGRLDVPALERTLSEIVRRHEVLRTTFATVDGQPVQRIAPAEPLALPVTDLTSLADAEREAAVRRRLAEEARRPFDLSRGPLFRPALLRCGREEHVLLLPMHHIVTDAWSIGVFVRECTALYRAFSEGRPSPLPELEIQYADFAGWQREWLRGDVLEAQLAYWAGRLAGAPPVLELPTDRPRPAVQSLRGARRSVTISSELAEALAGLARREGVTLFMLLLAAFKVLLYRYTGQEDIVVGSPVAARSRVELEGLIGFFVNMLPLRTDLSGHLSFRELLGGVREVALGAYAHQDLPVEKLIEALRPERDPSVNPLFQVVFALQNTPMPPLELPGLALSVMDVETDTTKFDLSLVVAETGRDLSATLECSTDLYDRSTIGRMLDHFRTLLAGVAAKPDQPIGTLPILTGPERHQLLVEWNDTAAGCPDRGVHHLFEEQAGRTPGALAVACGEQRLTYEELNRRANKLARHLTGLGVGPDAVVAVCMERSPDLVVGILGILKAGGAYLPIDPGYPAERLGFMLDDARVAVLLTQERLREKLPVGSTKVIPLDSGWDAMAEESEEDPGVATSLDNLAYVIYTSGSTGRPKGVEIQHAGLLNLVTWHRRVYAVTPTDRATHLAGLGFDATVWELWPYLTAGASLHMPPEEIRVSSSRLLEWLATERITISFLPTPLLEAVLEGPWSERMALRALLTGGDKLHAGPKRALPFDLANHYGPTENSVVTTYAPVAVGSQAPPIGRPIANTRVYVLDRNLQPVPVGVPGELHVGGIGLARGYRNRPELTREKFIPDPFGDRPGSRLYKTGDLVRYRPDGNLEFLGRIDSQVKIRGFRVELGEIEAVLGQHPSVRDSAVVPWDHAPGGMRLVAYFTVDGGEPPASANLRAFLKRKLPDYMVPSTFVRLDALPLTRNGKVDRRALPPPDEVTPPPERAFAAPRDALELVLAKTWEKVLDVQPIGIRESFFDLGGHSLLAVRLFAEIEKALGKSIPLAALFQASTIEGLAARIREDGWAAPWSSLVPIQPAGSKPPFFCVHAHGGHVLFYRDLARHLAPDQPFYGLQARGLDGQEPAATRIEEMAENYLGEIRALQPEGPYFLGGYCSGGLVAFEMAQQLHAAGQRVALLALLDTYGRHVALGPTRRGLASLVGRAVQRIDFEIGNLLLLTPREQWGYLLQKAKRIVARNRVRIDVLVGRRESPLNRIQRANLTAVLAYVPRVYPGHVVLFRAGKRPLGYRHDPLMGWDELAGGGLTVHEVPGYQAAIIDEPRVRVLAMKLRACLAEAQGKAGGG
ncbi:MAG: amino acid adenylation domain-containing protein [Candidatus Rokubacteria bacterium]|nr:amino acid adenylation domain-containing protein [Candidatus Rokubacteria bacterium]